jgi:uncharacterized protein
MAKTPVASIAGFRRTTFGIGPLLAVALLLLQSPELAGSTALTQRRPQPPAREGITEVGEQAREWAQPAVCQFRHGGPRPHDGGDAAFSPIGSDFGLLLAAAARAQTREVGIYTARYQRIAYPMGDVAPLHGACTDVVIRAYRALGIDLQELVHRSRVGTGDANIDHRRTETLRRFFARYGQSVPVTDFPEDYRPGDIVTYYRPFSRVSRSHIAIVSDVLAPAGRPMIVHNRGWGPQLEDALFVDRITGHYRFTGSTTDRKPVAAPGPVPSALRP